jgi:hypothetical protein
MRAVYLQRTIQFCELSTQKRHDAGQAESLCPEEVRFWSIRVRNL